MLSKWPTSIAHFLLLLFILLAECQVKQMFIVVFAVVNALQQVLVGQDHILVAVLCPLDGDLQFIESFLHLLHILWVVLVFESVMLQGTIFSVAGLKVSNAITVALLTLLMCLLLTCTLGLMHSDLVNSSCSFLSLCLEIFC